MFKKSKVFTEKHPYAYVSLIMVITSFIGISIEYIVNQDFIGGALYTAIALTIIELLRVKKRNKTKH
ncbi:hypothetical protein LHA31_00810 [Carnobacterium viridans]|uniref:Uncharacterized protein n=1 Tax=Carnobacterium viridans TaxID=174587 RepID=A0A1H0Y2W6_9LACT|nr:hypothetical protein [Carnobacterium viridans]UDE95380.1 hypothetical protein LHA31_00810 [Carnobacterium viridans]SDQ09435.1 hypothetical protein SAMN04487752_0662 [Carnobacterium viridans]